MLDGAHCGDTRNRLCGERRWYGWTVVSALFETVAWNGPFTGNLLPASQHEPGELPHGGGKEHDLAVYGQWHTSIAATTCSLPAQQQQQYSSSQSGAQHGAHDVFANYHCTPDHPYCAAASFAVYFYPLFNTCLFVKATNAHNRILRGETKAA